MKTKYVVVRDTVIAGHPYAAGDPLKTQHESKVPNLLRLRHIEEASAEPEKPAEKTAEKPAEKAASKAK